MRQRAGVDHRGGAALRRQALLQHLHAGRRLAVSQSFGQHQRTGGSGVQLLPPLLLLRAARASIRLSMPPALMRGWNWL